MLAKFGKPIIREFPIFIKIYKDVRSNTEAYSGTCKNSKMELFVNGVIFAKTIFAKTSS